MRFINSRQLIILLVISISIFFLYSCEKEISTSPPEKEPPQGFLFVDSNPQNYKIYLDGRFTGRFTPDTLPYIEETEHLIELKKKYWLDSSALTFAEPGELKSIYIDFMQNPKVYGQLKFVSKPDSAVVEINDSITDIKTPNVLQGILPGVYQIEYHLKQHRSTSSKAIVQSNTTTTVTLALQDTSVWVDYTVAKSGLPTNHITTLAVDQNNRVWAGTINNGIILIKGNKIEYMNSNNSILPSDRIRVIEVDKNNTVWIGTDNGLAEFSNGSIRNIYDGTNTDLSNNSKINAIGFYHNIVFVGTVKGILKIDAGETKLFEIVNDLGNSEVTAITVDESVDKIYTGIRGQMLTFQIRSGEIVSNPKVDDIGDFLKELDLTKIILRPDDGKLWALFSVQSGKNQDDDLVHGTPYLCVWNGSKWLYQMLESENLILTDVTVSKDNYVWISSNVGLRQQITLRDVEFLYRTYNSGIFSDDLTAVEEDQDGTIWIGSVDGLFKYKRQLEN